MYVEALCFLSWSPTGNFGKSCHYLQLQLQMSYEKNPPTFHYTGWFLGIPKQPGFFHCSNRQLDVSKKSNSNTSLFCQMYMSILEIFYTFLLLRQFQESLFVAFNLSTGSPRGPAWSFCWIQVGTCLFPGWYQVPRIQLRWVKYLDVRLEVRKWVITYLWMGYIGVIIHLLAIYLLPRFLVSNWCESSRV